MEKKKNKYIILYDGVTLAEVEAYDEDEALDKAGIEIINHSH